MLMTTAPAIIFDVFSAYADASDIAADILPFTPFCHYFRCCHGLLHADMLLLLRHYSYDKRFRRCCLLLIFSLLLLLR